METPDTVRLDDSMPDEDVCAQFHDLNESLAGRTLLPTPLARAVSIATRSTSFALRVGTLLGGYGFDAARITTLSSLELGRALLEGILGRAGRDVMARTGSDLGKADAETVLERSLENLHRTMTQIAFWTTTGFHMTGTTLSMFSETSQLLLSTLDQFFGSTDSSRAMASIITLIRREFQHPATGIQGEKVGVTDLVLGLCGMAYLQRWSHRLIEEEDRNLRLEETVWDVVVLSDGVRVDVHEESLYGVHRRRDSEDAGRLPNGRLLVTIEDHGAQDSEDDRDCAPEIRLKQQIIRSLPDNASVRITTQSNTTKTITVDIVGGTRHLPLSPPPGVELVEETRDSVRCQKDSAEKHIPPACRVVYRLHRNKERRTSFRKEDGDISQVAGYVEEVNDTESQAGSATDHEVDEASPAVPPKETATAPATPARRRARRPSSAASIASSTSTLSAKPSRIPSPSVSKERKENTANQKRPRMPLANSSVSLNSPPPPPSRRQSLNRFLSGRKENEPSTKSGERKPGFREVLKRPATLFNKDDSGSDSIPAKKGKQVPPPSHSGMPARRSSLIPRRDISRPLPQARPSMVHSARPASKEEDEPFPRTSSRASYISVHERRRDSMISQTDTYSITAAEDYSPVSPAAVAVETPGLDTTPTKSQRRLKHNLNYTPSIYTLRTNESQTTLVPFYYPKGAFSDTETMGTLRRAGIVDGMFPRFHLLRNIERYMRFASASYGSSFLKVMGIAKEMPILRALDDTHHEVRSFAHHTESNANSILLCSFVDPQGGSDGTGSTNTGVPLVHYISLDHESKAVVLTCRGTLGFEDVLADMTCDYDELIWRGNTYKVHKGVHASARRLLYGGDGRVLFTLKQALEEFSDYGLVLTGHSLGGAVTALLGVMLSEPAPVPASASGTSFVTSSEPHRRLLSDGRLSSSSSSSQPYNHVCLPSGRPVHVFAYGPPSTMSASLCHKTRGLITSIVNGNDLVPYLSLGVLHDFQAVALAFKTDNNDAKVEVRQRIRDAFHSGIAGKLWYGSSSSSTSSSSFSSSPFSPPSSPPSGSKDQASEDEQWAYAALKVLRASMMSQKLLPPGEVFVVETTRVLRRDPFWNRDQARCRAGEHHLGKPAQRIVLRYVRDVEKRFREVRFGTSMLTDHSPGKYEDALSRLRAGVMEAS